MSTSSSSSATNDPWCSLSEEQQHREEDLKPEEKKKEEKTLKEENKFGDNFTEHRYLPDSAEYLARLEKKLEKLTSSSNNSRKNNNKNSISRKEEVLNRLINDETITVDRGIEEISLDPPHPLIARLNPSQPLTNTELINLIKADSLDVASSSSDDNEQR